MARSEEAVSSLHSVASCTAMSYRVRIQLETCSCERIWGWFAGLRGGPCRASLAHARFRRRISAFRFVRCKRGGPIGFWRSNSAKAWGN